MYLQHGSGEILARLRPVRSMKVTITRADMVPISDLQDMTSCDAHITDLTLHAGPALIVSSMETMQYLTSLALVGMDLNGLAFDIS